MNDPPNNSLWSPNETNHCYPPQRDMAIYTLIIVTNVLAIVINLFVIIITVSMATLRRCVSSYLVIKLCAYDILASCASMPKFIRLLSTDCRTVLEDGTYCVVYEFLNGFFAYSICACILAINVDKYHSIKFPMHYSSHVTKTTVLITQGIILLLSIVFSSTPLYATSGTRSRSCSHIYSHGLVNMPFAVVTVLLYFIFPAICMTYMNISVYRVAKRSLAQISAAPTITYDAFYKRSNTSIKKDKRQETISVIAFGEKNGLNNSTFCATLTPDDKTNRNIDSIFHSHPTKHVTGVETVQCCDGFPLDCSNLANWKACPPNTSDNLQCSDMQRKSSEKKSTCLMSPKDLDMIKHVPKVSRNNAIKKNTFVQKTNYKAVRSLVIPYVYFIVIWGSYFIVYLSYVHGNYSDTLSPYYKAVGVLVYLSFALNPVIFVLMRKNFKEESIEFFRSCRRKPNDLSVMEIGMSQTFQQFLDSSA